MSCPASSLRAKSGNKGSDSLIIPFAGRQAGHGFEPYGECPRITQGQVPSHEVDVSRTGREREEEERHGRDHGVYCSTLVQY
jgi:hypothetical protein